MRISFLAITAFLTTALTAAPGLVPPLLAETGWHAQTLPEAILYMVVFAILGIMLAIVGYKVFDRFTPGDLHREILENRNVAAAILGGSVILGVCVIIAASMLG